MIERPLSPTTRGLISASTALSCLFAGFLFVLSGRSAEAQAQGTPTANLSADVIDQQWQKASSKYDAAPLRFSHA